MSVMAQDLTGQNTEYLASVKNLSYRSKDKCKQVIVKLVIPRSKKCVLLGIKIFKDKLVPCINKSSSCICREIVKIHSRQNWFKRCGITMLDNAAGLGMAMLTGKIVQNYVEVQQFSNLWGLLATRPVVNETTYEVLSFAVEFFIALTAFTLTEHYLTEYRQKKNTAEIPSNTDIHSGEIVESVE